MDSVNAYKRCSALKAYAMDRLALGYSSLIHNGIVGEQVVQTTLESAYLVSKIKWHVENVNEIIFNYHPYPVASSPRLIIGRHKQYAFRMEFLPNGWCGMFDSMGLVVHLCNGDGNEEKINAVLEMDVHFISQNGAFDLIARCKRVEINSSSGVSLPVHIGKRKYHQMERDVALRDFQVVCTLRIAHQEPEGLPKNLELRLFCPDTSDVRLVVDGVQVPAHIAVLSAQSRVFAAMFHADMLERNLQVVNIHNVPLNVVKEVLRFLYTGRVHDLEGTIFKMLIFSDMYAIQPLKFFCENEIVKRIDKSCASAVLFFSERYNSKEMKRQALNFISENMHEVFETDTFQWLIKFHPHLIKGIYYELDLTYKTLKYID